MLYNINKKKVLFIHIPKTGGSSIGTILKPYMLKTPEIVGHQGYDECIKFYNPDYIFTVIRNPWDWRSSWYHYIKEYPFDSGHIFEYEKIKFLNFNEHLNWIYNEPKENFTESNYNGKVSKLFLKSQSDYIGVGNVKLLRFENIKDDFEKYMLELGLEIKLDKKIRKSTNYNYREYYNKKSIEIVKKMWLVDINKFKYEY